MNLTPVEVGVGGLLLVVLAVELVFLYLADR
jgi:hypothetical protein